MVERFFEWLDKVLAGELGVEIEAISFNLYEDGDELWSVEFVGAGSFDEDDDDWACDEVFVNREEPFVIEGVEDWEEVFEQVKKFIKRYLKKGKYAEKLKGYQAVALGFVDGELEVVYQK